MADLSSIGSNDSFDDQKKDIIKRWGADSLIEDSFKKTTSVEELEKEQEEQEKSSVSALFDSRNIELKTELNHKEVLAVSRLLFCSHRYKLSGVECFINDFLKLKVSHNRRGRGEFIEGLHAEEKKSGMRELGPLTSFMSRIGL